MRLALDDAAAGVSRGWDALLRCCRCRAVAASCPCAIMPTADAVQLWVASRHQALLLCPAAEIRLHLKAATLQSPARLL